ncbi:MAG: apolipoprotein N-acyltransferase [Hyphomicrobiales bacterium]
MIRAAQRIRRLAGWKRFWTAFAGGALAAFSMPPFGLWPVLAIAVPVMLLLIEGIAARNWRAALAAGWSFGFGYFAVSFHWIGFAFLVDAKTYLWMMPFALGGLAGSMAGYWALAAVAVKLANWRGLSLVFGFAAALAVAELLRGRLFTGFPWTAPGLAAESMGALAQTAALIGMTGLSLLIVLWAGLPLVFLHADRRRRDAVIAAVLALLLPLGWMWGQLRLADAAAGHVAGVRLRIVQPNIAQDEKWREDNARAIFDKLVALTIQPSAAYPAGIADITHVIWPESAVPFLIDESAVARAELRRVLNGKAVLIMGAIRRDPLRKDGAGTPLVYNSVLAFDGDANMVGHYDKWRLVPGGEFLPFESILEPLGFRRVVTVPGSFAAGAGPVRLRLPGAPDAGVLVCYEAIFPHDLVDGAKRPQWLLNVTNDGWFGNSTGPHQHLAQARMRAIEQGLPMVRAANTGISAVTDAHGRLGASLPLMSEGVIDSILPAAIAPTLYAGIGDLALLLLVLVAAAAAALLNGGRN